MLKHTTSAGRRWNVKSKKTYLAWPDSSCVVPHSSLEITCEMYLVQRFNLIDKFISNVHFLCLRPSIGVSGGIMFSGWSSVSASMRASVRPCVLLLARYLTNRWTYIHQTLVHDVVEVRDELTRFWRSRESRSRSRSQKGQNLSYCSGRRHPHRRFLHKESLF